MVYFFSTYQKKSDFYPYACYKNVLKLIKIPTVIYLDSIWGNKFVDTYLQMGKLFEGFKIVLILTIFWKKRGKLFKRGSREDDN